MAKWAKHDLTGRRFGRLVVRSFVVTDKPRARWLCACDCGETTETDAASLTRGLVRSCGCLAAEETRRRATRHGGSKDAAYGSWRNMMSRSAWMNHPSAKSYGHKGIVVCERWRKYENFLADMGPRPQGCSVDRIDNTKGYEPGNCRWATAAEQSRNTSRNIRLLYKGRILCVKDVCGEEGLSIPAVRSRAIRRGGDYVAAFRSVGVEVERVGADLGVEWSEERAA